VNVMARRVETITVRRVTYRVQRVADPEALLLPVKFVLHDPRGRSWLLIPSKDRPDRLVARAPMTHFSSFRLPPTSLIRVLFAEDEDGKLVIAPHDA
jgi:hypothetical protein